MNETDFAKSYGRGMPRDQAVRAMIGVTDLVQE